MSRRLLHHRDLPHLPAPRRRGPPTRRGLHRTIQPTRFHEISGYAWQSAATFRQESTPPEKATPTRVGTESLTHGPQQRPGPVRVYPRCRKPRFVHGKLQTARQRATRLLSTATADDRRFDRADDVLASAQEAEFVHDGLQQFILCAQQGVRFDVANNRLQFSRSVFTDR